MRKTERNRRGSSGRARPPHTEGRQREAAPEKARREEAHAERGKMTAVFEARSLTGRPGRSFAVFHKGEAEASAGAGKENGDVGEGGLCRTEKPCGRAAESGGDMASTPHGEEKRTKEHASAAPCGSMRRLLQAFAARKKTSEPGDALRTCGSMREGRALREKRRVPSASRTQCGICCVQNEQKRKSSPDFRFVVSASAVCRRHQTTCRPWMQRCRRIQQ